MSNAFCVHLPMRSLPGKTRRPLLRLYGSAGRAVGAFQFEVWSRRTGAVETGRTIIIELN
jgi:hypothetical protein